jgi:hypothetical protein
MGYAEEEQDRAETIDVMTNEERFEGVSDKELIEAYKKNKKEQSEEKKKKIKDNENKVTQETHRFQDKLDD